MDPIIKITISYSANGQVTVEGIPGNAVLAYGLLDVARDIIKNNIDNAANKLVQPATIIPS